MESFFEFLVRSSAAIALLYIVYWIFLRNETFYQANRWYFIVALSLSVLLPLFPLRYAVPVHSGDTTVMFQALHDNFGNIRPDYSVNQAAPAGSGLINILTFVYIIGSALVLLRLVIQTRVLVHLIARSKIVFNGGIRVAENKNVNTVFTFFNIMFINPEQINQNDLPKIIAHEKVHIREYHWIDLIIIELMTVFFWFNPFIWFYEHSMRQNHEYLADNGVLSMGYSKDQYRELLMNQAFGLQVISITNSLNFALNKNRFKMMTKKKTPGLRSLKFLIALPVLAAIIFACAEPWYQNQNNSKISINEIPSGSVDIIEITGKIVDEQGNPIPGVSVVIKGTTVGTVTNPGGFFEIKFPPEYDLVLSYVGKETIVDNLSDLKSEPIQEKYQRRYVMREGVFNIDREKHFSSPPPPPPPPSSPAGERTDQPGSAYTVTDEDGSQLVFFVVEELPVYPGNFYALGQYVKSMEEKLSREQNLKGEVLVGFTIDENGKVSDIRVLETDNITIASSAIDIVSGMADWTPGKQRGKPVPVNFTLPLEF
ncbi:MAG: carboxypeptidase-like regulatory domain-containing protein [Bacteroidales bacterium]